MGTYGNQESRAKLSSKTNESHIFGISLDDVV